MEEPNVPRALGLARKVGVKFDIMTTSFFFSRQGFRASSGTGMPLWQDHLFIALSSSLPTPRPSAGCHQTAWSTSASSSLSERLGTTAESKPDTAGEPPRR
jgi:hypothetical protein